MSHSLMIWCVAVRLCHLLPHQPRWFRYTSPSLPISGPRCCQKWICECSIVSYSSVLSFTPRNVKMASGEMWDFFFFWTESWLQWLSSSTGHEKVSECFFLTGALSTGIHLVQLSGWGKKNNHSVHKVVCFLFDRVISERAWLDWISGVFLKEVHRYIAQPKQHNKCWQGKILQTTDLLKLYISLH